MVADVRAAKGAVHKADHTDARNNVRAVVVEAGLKTFSRD